MKKSVLIILFILVFSLSYASQDKPSIPKGQLLQAPKIVRSSKVNWHIDRKHHPLKTDENPLYVLFKAQVPPGIWSETKNCGQTSALMVFCYYNATTPTEQGIKNIDDWLYQKYGDPINNYNGSETNTTKLEELAKEYGEFTNSYKANDWDIERLKQEIDAGHPVIVAVIAGHLSNRGYE
ncbi:MAG: C39 family peptidase [Candidatus Cloacimonetes bacterium]|nr:C39 family peptidase [Candidatus Cloacimonadota bacterium]